MSQWKLETIKRSHRRTGSGNVAELEEALHTERAESHEQLLVQSTLTTGERAPVQCLVSAGDVQRVERGPGIMDGRKQKAVPRRLQGPRDSCEGKNEGSYSSCYSRR